MLQNIINFSDDIGNLRLNADSPLVPQSPSELSINLVLFSFPLARATQHVCKEESAPPLLLLLNIILRLCFFVQKL